MVTRYPPLPADIAALAVARQRKTQLHKQRLGLCVSCAEPRVDSTYCAAHRSGHNAWKKQSDIKRKLRWQQRDEMEIQRGDFSESDGVAFAEYKARVAR